MLPHLALFVSFYLATFLAGLRLGAPNNHWIALASVIVATIATIGIWEQGDWRLGLAVPIPRATIEFAAGLLFAACLIGAADLMILAATDVHHEPGLGFPVAELLIVFAPAAFHEELLFRGYPFQKLWRRRRRTSIVAVSIVFAALHLGNYGVTVIGMTNVFLGGVVLSLAYERYQRLWFPIGLHLGWNVMSGPILGYGVSGYEAQTTVLRTVGGGPVWLTGGEFGIEGSVFMTVAEVVAIVVLWRRTRNVECSMVNVEC